MRTFRGILAISLLFTASAFGYVGTNYSPIVVGGPDPAGIATSSGTTSDASNIVSGTLSDARLSANVALLDANPQAFTGSNTFNGVFDSGWLRFGTSPITRQVLFTNFSIGGGILANHAYDIGAGDDALGAASNCFQFVSNATISGVTFTNDAALPSGVILLKFGLLNAFTTNFVTLDDSTIYSGNRGVGVVGVSGDIRNTKIYSKGPALETRSTHLLVIGSVFDSYLDGPESLTSAYLANDVSSNIFVGCSFFARNSTNQNTVLYQWSGAEDYYYGCNFHIGSSVASLGNGLDGIVNMSEDSAKSYFNYCTFDLAYTNAPVIARLGFYENEGASHITEFNYCTVRPETNGVIFDMDNFNNSSPTFGGDVLIVRGGNLKPSNFSHPEYVTFIGPTVSLSTSNYTSAATARTMNTWGGKVKIASGSQTYVVTDSLVDNTCIATATVNTTNATAVSCQAFPGTGVLTLKLNASASADCDVSWAMIKPNSQ